MILLIYPGVVLVLIMLVIADDDEYNTQDTYLPTGTMFELDRGTEVELVEWADGAPAFVK